MSEYVPEIIAGVAALVMLWVLFEGFKLTRRVNRIERQAREVVRRSNELYDRSVALNAETRLYRAEHETIELSVMKEN